MTRHILPAALTAILTLSAASAALTGCSSEAESKATDSVAEQLPLVDIRSVTLQSVPQIATYTATIEAFKTNNISTSTPNRIKSILVDVGSKVAAGQRVVLLDNVNIDQLQINLENTEREYNRARQLLEVGIMALLIFYPIQKTLIMI